jgi:uncharacterized membrane protein
MDKIYQVFAVVMLIVMVSFIAYLGGYVVGYNDNLATEIAKHRVAKKVRK